MPSKNHQTPARLLTLGDSYTIGTYVTEDESWPHQLAARLAENGIQVSEPTIIAQNGWTTGDLLAGVGRRAPGSDFDLVALLIGVNNQYQGSDIDIYRSEFDLLLSKAIAFAGDEPSKVIVISIPDWSVTPFAAGFNRQKVSREIELYNAINRQLSSQAGVNYIDITPLSRHLGSDPAYLAEDGLHPSGKMYLAWVELLLPAAVRIIKSEKE